MKYENICAVIPIGGKGTRLKKVTSDIPKPLFPINGKSTLFRACKELSIFGIKKVFVSIGYNSQICIEYIEKIKKELSLEIYSYQEENPLGECGSLWEIKDKLSKTIIFINGDLIFSISIDRFLKFHQNIDSELTLITHTSSHPEDSDLVSVPNGIQINSIFLKSDKNHSSGNAYLGNAGIALLEKTILDKVTRPKDIKKSSLFHHLVRNSFKKSIRVFSYNTSEYIKDMGTPKRFFQIERDLKSNLVTKKNYFYRQKALFLDRDNTLISCKKGKYILSQNDMVFIDTNIEKISKYAESYNLVCMITNQPQISMGLLTIEDLDNINSVLVKYCLKKGLKIDVISFCPHHPHGGYKNEITFLKGDCFCRKPSPGMLLHQSYLRNIDLSKSLFIGDSWVDKESAHEVNCGFLDVKNL